MKNSAEDEYFSIYEEVETLREINQKIFNFLKEKGLVGEFRMWESKTRGIPGWSK